MPWHSAGKNPSQTFLLCALVCSSCSDHPQQPAAITSNELLPLVLDCGSWRLHACPGGWQGTPTPAPPIEHATSYMEVYGNGGRQIIDTLESPGFVVTHEYDEIGVVRDVLVEDPKARLAVRIELDSNGTIRQIETLRLERETKDGYLSVGIESGGWRFALDERGRVQRSESGVTFEGKVVRSIE